MIIDYTNMAYCGYYHSIQALLSAPNPDDPLSENIAKHWKTNEAEAVDTGILLITIYCSTRLARDYVNHS